MEDQAFEIVEEVPEIFSRVTENFLDLHVFENEVVQEEKYIDMNHILIESEEIRNKGSIDTDEVNQDTALTTPDVNDNIGPAKEKANDIAGEPDREPALETARVSDVEVIGSIQESDTEPADEASAQIATAITNELIEKASTPEQYDNVQLITPLQQTNQETIGEAIYGPSEEEELTEEITGDMNNFEIDEQIYDNDPVSITESTVDQLQKLNQATEPFTEQSYKSENSLETVEPVLEEEEVSSIQESDSEVVDLENIETKLQSVKESTQEVDTPETPNLSSSATAEHEPIRDCSPEPSKTASPIPETLKDDSDVEMIGSTEDDILQEKTDPIVSVNESDIIKEDIYKENKE